MCINDFILIYIHNKYIHIKKICSQFTTHENICNMYMYIWNVHINNVECKKYSRHEHIYFFQL